VCSQLVGGVEIFLKHCHQVGPARHGSQHTVPRERLKDHKPEGIGIDLGAQLAAQVFGRHVHCRWRAR